MTAVALQSDQTQLEDIEIALLLEGLHPNPAAMVGRLQALMEAAARHPQD